MNTLTTADIIVFFSTIVATLLVGLVHNYLKKAKNENISGYLLANNQIGPLFTGISICASMVSSIGLSVIPAEIVEGGIYVMIVSIISLGISYILIQIYVLPILTKHKLPSIFAIVKQKYGLKTYRFVLFAGLPGAVMLNAIIMFTPALAIHAIFYKIPIQVLILMSNLLVLVYTFVGGYSMVIITDLVQCSIIILGVCYVAYLAVFGGYLGDAESILKFADQVERVNFFGRTDSLLKNFSFYVKEGSLSLLFPTLFIFFIRSTGQENIQRLLAVKGGRKSARWAHVIASLKISDIYSE